MRLRESLAEVAKGLRSHAGIRASSRPLALVHKYCLRVGSSFIGFRVSRPYDEDARPSTPRICTEKGGARVSTGDRAATANASVSRLTGQDNARDGGRERDSCPPHAWINNLFHIYITTTGTPWRGTSKWEVLDRLGLRIRNLFCVLACSTQFIMREWSWRGEEAEKLPMDLLFYIISYSHYHIADTLYYYFFRSVHFFNHPIHKLLLP